MGKTLIEFRTSLRLDLKDSSTLWSDSELARSIQKAVNDLMRVLPLKKVYEMTLGFPVTNESFPSPATADPDYVVDEQTLVGCVDGDELSKVSGHWNISPARRLTVTLTDANESITSLIITAKGYDKNG